VGVIERRSCVARTTRQRDRRSRCAPFGSAHATCAPKRFQARQRRRVMSRRALKAVSHSTCSTVTLISHASPLGVKSPEEVQACSLQTPLPLQGNRCIRRRRMSAGKSWMGGTYSARFSGPILGSVCHSLETEARLFRTSHPPSRSPARAAAAPAPHAAAVVLQVVRPRRRGRRE